MAGLIFLWGQGAPPVSGTGGQAGLIFFWFSPGTVVPPEPDLTIGIPHLIRRRRRGRR